MAIAFYAQSHAITAPKQLAMPVVATGVIVDPIAIANVEAVLGAIPPDRALHEPWKRRRKDGIELAGVNVGCKQMENPSDLPAGSTDLRTNNYGL